MTEGCPPERESAERSCIHIALNHGPGHLAAHLEAHHFFSLARRHILKAATTLSARGEPVDLVTVMGELAREGNASEHTRGELLACDEAISAPANVAHYARLVREGYVRSEGRRLGLELSEGPDLDRLSQIGRELAVLEEQGSRTGTRLTLSEAAHAFTNLDPAHLRVPEPLLGDGLICRSDLALLAGRPRLGKSRIAIELAVACARGEPWLGLATHRPARVGYVAAEFTAYRFLERCVQLFHGAPHTNGPASLLEAYRSLGFSANGGFVLPIPSDLPSDTLNLLTDAGARSLERFVTDFALELCVLDPLGRLMGGQDETNEFFGQAVATLDRVRNQTGCAILVVHHERKESKDQRGNPDPLDAIRGGTKLTDFSNTVMRVSQGPGTLKVVSFPKANFAVTPEDIYLSIPKNGGRSVLEQSPEKRSTGNRERIAAWAATQEGAFTTDQAAKAVGMTKKPVREHLEKLAESGSVKMETGPKNVTLWSRSGESGEQRGVSDYSPD